MDTKDRGQHTQPLTVNNTGSHQEVVDNDRDDTSPAEGSKCTSPTEISKSRKQSKPHSKKHRGSLGTASAGKLLHRRQARLGSAPARLTSKLSNTGRRHRGKEEPVAETTSTTTLDSSTCSPTIPPEKGEDTASAKTPHSKHTDLSKWAKNQMFMKYYGHKAKDTVHRGGDISVDTLPSRASKSHYNAWRPNINSGLHVYDPPDAPDKWDTGGSTATNAQRQLFNNSHRSSLYGFESSSSSPSFCILNALRISGMPRSSYSAYGYRSRINLNHMHGQTPQDVPKHNEDASREQRSTTAAPAVYFEYKHDVKPILKSANNGKSVAKSVRFDTQA